MSETTGQMPAVTCPLCGKPAQQVHTQQYKDALPLYQGPTPAGFFDSMKEGGPFGARRVLSAAGKELAVEPGKDAVHCLNCKVITFRYEG